MMRCETFIEKFMEIDDYSSIPLSLKIHMAICLRCNMEAGILMEEMNRLSGMSPYETGMDITHSVMKNIAGENRTFRSTVPNPGWVIAGAVIFMSMFLITLSSSFAWIKGAFGAGYTVPMNIVMGTMLSLYSILFAGSIYRSFSGHMESLVRRIGRP